MPLVRLLFLKIFFKEDKQMKKYYLALTFSSIAIFILAMVAYGMVVKPFFTPEYIAYAIALAIYIVIGNFICFIIMYIANKYTKKLINDSRKHIKTVKEELSIISHT